MAEKSDFISFDSTKYMAPFFTVPTVMASEMAEFGAARLQANAERLRHWAHAKTPAEFFDGEMKFATDALNAYSDEAARIMDLVGSATETPEPAPKKPARGATA